ncbi:MAG: dephospho-CoA kinase [Chloroflexota bacterium]
MSKWPGKYVIGLTGNIATGKSVVRKMLEHLGAYGIDADALSHRAIAKGAPGYQPVVDTFGVWILGPDRQIDRAKLGRLVFADPEALARLEAIIHPLVGQAIDIMVRRAGQSVIVIEAIKLLEGDLRNVCDSIWVTHASRDLQLIRLTQKRQIAQSEAVQRIEAQEPQEQKTVVANVVIRNTGSFEDTWKQVTQAWKNTVKDEDTGPVVVKPAAEGDFTVQRGRPRDSELIASMISSFSKGHQKLTPSDVMAAFGEKAFMLLHVNNTPVGLAGWQVENLVARTTDFYLAPQATTEKALETLIGEVEQASHDLQVEASLIFLSPELAEKESMWKKLGYERRTPESLGVQAWQDAVHESQPQNTVLFFKQLRQDRVLRPI